MWHYQPIPAAAADLLADTHTISASDSCGLTTTDIWREITDGATVTYWHVEDAGAIHLVPEIGLTPEAKTASDSSAVGLSESSPAFTLPSSVGATDAGSVGASDAIDSSSPRAIAATDSCRVVSDDELLLDHFVTIFRRDFADTLVGQISDATPTIVAVLTASDAVAVQASDSVNELEVEVRASDSLTLGAGEAVASCTGSVGATDSAACPVTDAAVLSVAASASESCAIQASEAQPTIVAVLSASDGLTVNASGVASIFVSASCTDSLFLGPVDAFNASTPQAIVTLDSLMVAASDLANVQGRCMVDEALAIPLTEALSCAVTVSGTDALPSFLTESASITLAVSAKDDAAIQVSDALPDVSTGTVTAKAVTDDLVVAASEQAALALPIQLASQDAVLVAANEVLQNATQPCAANDTLGLVGSEGTTNALSSTAADFVPLPASEVAGLLLARAAADALVLGLTDVVTFAGEPLALLTLAVSDTCAIGLDDLARTPVFPADVMAVMLLESATVTHTQVEQYWGGGMRQEEAYHVYATSVRMGPLPPDQDRGSQW